MKTVLLPIIALSCLPTPAIADPSSDTRGLYRAITIRVAILETLLLEPVREPLRTAGDIQRLVYEPVSKAMDDWMGKAVEVAGKNSPYLPYGICYEAALDFRLHVGEVQYALKSEKPLPEIAADHDYREKLSACATAIGA